MFVCLFVQPTLSDFRIASNLFSASIGDGEGGGLGGLEGVGFHLWPVLSSKCLLCLNVQFFPTFEFSTILLNKLFVPLDFILAPTLWIHRFDISTVSIRVLRTFGRVL